ncbi:MAG: patatin-like phospholipase family protein [Firmicutes bacterium]|nr:patatin-like phospholipase family protein [Bacillota bacterium]
MRESLSFLLNIIKPRERKLHTAEILPKKAKLGIAFGGGGFKGAAHVGVLKVLSEYNIKPDMVAGTSVGAAVAALLASGYTWQMMQTLLNQFDLDAMMKIRPNKNGLIPAKAYTELIHTCVKGKKIEEMDIPLKIVAVDLVSWKKVIFDKGETALAVRASSAIPGVFTPVKMGDMLLADGYLLDVCPTRVVREMGADIVLAISLFSPNYSTPQNMLEIINRAIDIATAANRCVDADWLVEPIPHHLNSLNSKIIPQCIELGEQAARAKIASLLDLCQAQGISFIEPREVISK